jgi:alkanesulfonate monooxygenase SsuD/methylene tetrahydromethanopterin reductase-like flavin-dependent oxidoreductase (luciferase family)
VAPPIWIGGSSPRAARRAADHGDGWIPVFVSPGGLADRFGTLDAMLKANRRDPAEVERGVALWTRVTSSRAEEREAFAWLGRLYGLPEEVAARHLIVGSPQRCLDRMMEYARAGADEIVVVPAADDPSPMVAALFSALGTTSPRVPV